MWNIRFSDQPPSGETWNSVVALSWATPQPFRSLVQGRRGNEGIWRGISEWLEPIRFDEGRKLWVYEMKDGRAEQSAVLWYRIQVESAEGNLNVEFDERQPTTP